MKPETLDKIANKIIEVLNLEMDRQGYYYTTWGKKTLQGLIETLKRVILEGIEENKTYKVKNRITKEVWNVEAKSAQEACQKVGWLIGDCFVEERR